MMATDDDIDLGNPRETPRERRRRRSSESGKSDTPRSSRPEPSEREVRNLLSNAFDKLAKNRAAKGDDELAEVFTEDADAMSEGVITLTGFAPILRMVAVVALNAIVTLLAFGRLGGILSRRWQERRMARRAEAAEYPPEFEEGPGGTPIEVVQ